MFFLHKFSLVALIGAIVLVSTTVPTKGASVRRLGGRNESWRRQNSRGGRRRLRGAANWEASGSKLSAEDIEFETSYRAAASSAPTAETSIDESLGDPEENAAAETRALRYTFIKDADKTSQCWNVYECDGEQADLCKVRTVCKTFWNADVCSVEKGACSFVQRAVTRQGAFAIRDCKRDRETCAARIYSFCLFRRNRWACYGEVTIPQSDRTPEPTALAASAEFF